MSPLDAPIVDAHSHTWSRAFRNDYDEAMARAWGSGLVAVVEVGGSAESSEEAYATSASTPSPGCTRTAPRICRSSASSSASRR